MLCKTEKGSPILYEIERLVKKKVEGSSKRAWYREPLVGFMDSDRDRVSILKKWVHPAHLLPGDLLRDARAVVAFFIPFSEEVVSANANGKGVDDVWAMAYIETNRLIDEIYLVLEAELSKTGSTIRSVPATHQFDRKTLMSLWSHKHVAYLCGLGTFGLNGMLITHRGCAGRIGSFVIDHPLPTGAPLAEELCAYRAKGICTECVKACPVGALTTEGFDRHRCHRYLLEIDAYFEDLDTCDVCGKCAVQRCALKPQGMIQHFEIR